LLRAFATVLAYAGVCAMLVLIGSQAGTARGETARLTTDTRSALRADYSESAVVPILSALKPEIVEAAARDNAALGLRDVVPSGAAVTEPEASEQSGQPPAPDDLLGAGSASGADAGTAPPATASTDEAAKSSGGGLPLMPILGALLITTCLAWGAYYVLRPRSD
jgi:hypothetical protein